MKDIFVLARMGSNVVKTPHFPPKVAVMHAPFSNWQFTASGSTSKKHTTVSTPAVFQQCFQFFYCLYNNIHSVTSCSFFENDAEGEPSRPFRRRGRAIISYSPELTSDKSSSSMMRHPLH